MVQTLKNDSVLLYKLSQMEKPRHLVDHAMYCGSSGSGKSDAAKSEIRQILELTDDLVVIVDYYNEYGEFKEHDRVDVLNFYSDKNYSIEDMETFYNGILDIQMDRMRTGDIKHCWLYVDAFLPQKAIDDTRSFVKRCRTHAIRLTILTQNQIPELVNYMGYLRIFSNEPHEEMEKFIELFTARELEVPYKLATNESFMIDNYSEKLITDNPKIKQEKAPKEIDTNESKISKNTEDDITNNQPKNKKTLLPIASSLVVGLISILVFLKIREK